MHELHTARLMLRPLAASDSNDLFAARRDEEVMAYWDGPPDENPAQTAAVTELLLAEMRSGTCIYWAIRLRADETFVGVCDLSEIRHRESADVGFMLLRKFWGRGFGGETIHCLLSHAKSLSLKFVTARIHSGNARSRLLLLKAGFQIVDEMQGYEIRPGVFRDCLRFEFPLP
jgi:[ribosomal protein S5]-alanine N-acetyltransferase